MALRLSEVWGRVVRAMRRWFARELPAASRALPAPEVLLGDLVVGRATVSDPRAEPWLRLLRAELPFPQPRYGTAEPPASPAEVVERLAALDAEIRAGSGLPGEAEPDWFVALADRFLPLAAWYAGVGLAGTGDAPDWLRELGQRVRRVPGAARTFEWLRDRIKRLTEHNAGSQAAYFALLKVHLEAALRGMEAEVVFDFPAPGARIANLDPVPAHGSPTSGTVARVLCPSVVVRVRGADGAREWSRGAHVRG